MFSFSLLHMDVQFSQQHLLKRLPFPHYVAVTSLSKLFGRLCKSLYLGSLYPILFVCVSVFFFLPEPYHLHYCCYAVCFKIRKCEASIFILF